jgi:hypothetical protein
MNTWNEYIDCPHYYIDKYGNKRCFAQICYTKIGARRCDGKVYKECLEQIFRHRKGLNEYGNI